MWYTSIDGSPGICEDALSILRDKAQLHQTEHHYPLPVTIISDDIAIRKYVNYDSEKGHFVGFATVTNSSEHNSDADTTQLKVAKDSLVFLVVGRDFKIPIAYHLLNGLNGIDRAALTLEAIRKVEETGVYVMSLTADGLFANVTVAEVLGANFEDNKPFFRSPTYPERRIFIIFDPCHMLKLVRNHFSLDMIHHKNNLLDWNVLEVLAQKQALDNFNLCNKLTQRHIDWYQKPMYVRYAAETISRSVADTLQQLSNDQYEEFNDCAATIEFLRIFNDAFDILNFAEKNKSDNRYKQPVCGASIEIIFAFADKFQQYIDELSIETKLKRIPILKSRAKMGFFGFYHNFTSLKGIYEDFVKNGPLNIFYTFQFNQDHIETFFSLIRYVFFACCLCNNKNILLNCVKRCFFRSRQGRNDNPSASEFGSAFRKLLVCHPLITSVDHNVLTNSTGILTVPSTYRKRLRIQSAPVQSEMEIDFVGLMENENNEMDPYDHHMVAYTAFCSEGKLLQKLSSNKFQCSDCANILLSSNEKINDDLLAMKCIPPAQAKQPCESTVKIVIFSNAVMKVMSLQSKSNSFEDTWKTIFNNINQDELYTYADFKHDERGTICNHKEEFIILVIKTYLTLKSRQIGRKITDEERGELIRNRRKHAIHEAGQ